MAIKNFFRALHTLPEDARKLLAGFCMLIAGVAFFGIWTSFISSRLVVLAPSPASPGAVGVGGEAPVVEAPIPVFPAPGEGEGGARSTPETTSPVAGIAETFRDLQKSVSGGTGIGQMYATSVVAEKAREAEDFFASVAHGAYVMIVGIGEGAADAAASAAELLYRALAR